MKAFWYLVTLLGTFSCQQAIAPGEPLHTRSSSLHTADAIYYGGDIVTMEGPTPQYVEAIVQGGGKIIFTGDQATALSMKSEKTRLIDLEGKTLLPGFIDAHSHFFHTAIKLSTVNLDPPPAGNTLSIGDIQSALSAELAKHPRTENQWLFGWGYDNAMLAENRQPTKMDLDRVSSEIPIAIYHFSSHLTVLNSRGLEILGFNADSVDPEGGVIRRLPNSQDPNGVIEEQAILPVLQLLATSARGQRLTELLTESQRLYQSEGFTTITESAGAAHILDLLRAYADSNHLEVDLMALPLASSQDAQTTSQQFSKNYRKHFRVGGGKINLDGGSPGRTAYLREPYFTQEAGMDPGYRGYPSIEDPAKLNAIVSSFYEVKTPIFIHALGDAAVDQAIQAIRNAQEKFPRQDVRTQLIHLQVLGEDQLDQLELLDVTLTFQTTHNFYFADYHNQFTLGPERTERLCPARSAMDRGFSVTIHHDSPVHPVSQLDLIWIASNRLSRSGKTYGAEERLTPYQALRASTIEAAYQFFEEDRKGSLKVGKLADLVILDKNPLRVPIQELKTIRVVETIKEGKRIWPKTQSPTDAGLLQSSPARPLLADAMPFEGQG
jgi:predicted amidohydrolase YtcJ